MTLQINLKQLKADGASNNYVLAWSNTSNSWTSANASSLVVAANSSVAGVVRVIDSYTNTSATIAAAANSVKTAYDAAVTAQNMAASAYTNAASVAATAYSNAVSTASADATTKAATAYTNAVAYAASNTYVNSTFAPIASPTFTGTLTAAVVAHGNTTITGFANVTGTLQVGGQLTVGGNLIINGTTTTVNTTSINVTDSLLYLATNNEISDSLDIGFAAHYNNGAGANGHTGLIRSATTKKYYLFQNYQPEFYANVANTGTGIQIADLVVGNLVANSTLIVTGATTLNNTLAAGNTTITGSLTANTGLLSANTIKFNDGSQQTTYIDPIAMAIALG